MEVEVAKPFPQSAQYQKAYKAAEDEDDPKGKKGTKSNKKKKNSKKRADVKNISRPTSENLESMVENPTYEANKYSEFRNMFLKDAMESRGISAREAAQEWNVSRQKRKMLAGLSVPELRRRRFIGKGEMENPWAIAESLERD